MRRTLALLTSAAVIGGIGGIGWLTTSESGLQTAIQLAERGTAGQLHIAGASGRLLGNLDIGQLRWQAPDLQIDATEIHLDWTPASLLHGVLQIAELRMSSLHIASTPSPTPTPAPTDLQLPVAVNAKKWLFRHFPMAQRSSPRREAASAATGANISSMNSMP
jgi:translocation and assembly module TamB